MEFWEFFFLMLIYVPITVLWIVSIVDVFHRPDLSGVGKAAWIVLLLVLPVLGAIIYLVARPSGVELELARRRNEAEIRRRLAAAPT